MLENFPDWAVCHGAQFKYIETPIIDDMYNEGAETFNVNLFDPVNVTILDDRGEGTILDTIDTTTLGLAGPATVNEGEIATYTLIVSNPLEITNVQTSGAAGDITLLFTDPYL